MGENKPSIKQRVTVSILPSAVAQEEVELDYRILVTGDYSKSKMGSHKDGKKLKDRRVRVIGKKDDFNKTLRDLNPQLKINVDDKISGEKDKKIPLEISVKNMKDFHPDQIAENVPALKKLLDARDRLNRLKMAVINDPDIGDSLNEFITSKDYGSKGVDALIGKLGPLEDEPEEDKKEEVK
jgi:type VI secretion system protein ImpB